MGKCHFNNSWLTQEDSNNVVVSSWAKQVNDDTILCCACNKKIVITRGFQAIDQHSKGEKHKRLFTLKFKPNQLHLEVNQRVVNTEVENIAVADEQTATNEQRQRITLFSVKENAVTAELYWVLWCVAKNYSFHSNDGISNIFKVMFPKDFPVHFSLSATKIRYYITECLGPYFLSKMLEDVRGMFFVTILPTVI